MTVRRRTLLGLGALGPALLALPGCAREPDVPDPDLPVDGLTALLGRIDPSSVPGAEPLAVSWSSPAAAATALGLDGSAVLQDPESPVRRLVAVTIAHPQLIMGPAPRGGIDTTAVLTAENLLATAEEIRVARGGGEVVLWTDSAYRLEDFADAVGWRYERDGEGLRRAEDQRGAPPPPTAHIAPLGEDLVLTSTDSTDVLDTGTSSADLFDDLPGLLAALDLDDAHLLSGRVESADGPVREWLWATRFDGAAEHTTRGAIRVAQDAPGCARRLLDGAAGSEDRMVVREAEADGDLVRVTVSNDPPSAVKDWDDVRHFYAAMARAEGPGVPIADAA